MDKSNKCVPLSKKERSEIDKFKAELLFNSNQVYQLSTPYYVFGAAEILMKAVKY